MVRGSFLLLLISVVVQAQTVRPKDVREMANSGSPAIPKLQELLKSPDVAVRVEVIKQLTEIGTQRSLDPLVLATRDNDPEVQVRATDGLVNFYLPGYVRNGFAATLKRAGTGIRGRFTDTNDQIIDPYITVRPDVIEALGKLARGGGSMEVRANAARAVGILRGGAAIPDLLEAIRTKDGDVIYESLVAIQKIGDRSAAPRVSFLLRDLDPRVQLAAIELTGTLRNQDALPDLVEVLGRARDVRVKRSALTSIAMLPAESSRPIFAQYLRDKDEKLRAAAAEGFARLRRPDDLPMLQKAWQEEGKNAPRLSLAFAQVMLGRTEISEFSPLQYLINMLNSASYRGVAQPFLLELARDAQVRQALYRPLQTGTRDEKIGLSVVLGASGDRATVDQLEKLTHDPDAEVAREALRAMRSLQARM